ncbi:MAG: hypothetical protein JWQ76_4541 [Ramlibacter sp.]|nr:hypothetical protein [Ramlibacter sp.]
MLAGAAFGGGAALILNDPVLIVLATVAACAAFELASRWML